jgi:hypothetical protein
LGEWNNTAYLHTGALDRVADALATLFRAEGMRLVPRPPERTPSQYDPMQYGGAGENDLWAMALVPGSEGWTALLTAPLELLCESSATLHRPRLAGLTELLGCDGLQLNLYDSDSLVLLEASPEGAFEVSGFKGMDDDPFVWHGLPIPEKKLQCGFRMIEIPGNPLGPFADNCDAAASKVARLLAGDCAAHCDNLVQVTKLIPHHDLGIAGARELYFRKGAG